MGTQPKYPNKIERVEVRRLFKEKIADPFNSTFGHITNNRGQQCFNIRVLEEAERGYAPEDLAQGQIYPLEANNDDYEMSLFFYTNGQGCACVLDHRKEPNRVNDSHEKVLLFVLKFMEAELEKVVNFKNDFRNDLSKVRTWKLSVM